MGYNKIVDKKYEDFVSRMCIAHRWVVNDDVRSVMKSLLMARDNVKKGDTLIQSILNNDLKQSIVLADYYVSRYLRELVFAKDNFFIK